MIPVNNEYHLDYAKSINEILLNNNIRVNLDEKKKKLSYKMRESQTKKIPYTLILGQNEVDNNLISYRKFGETETTTVGKDEFISLINNVIKNKER